MASPAKPKPADADMITALNRRNVELERLLHAAEMARDENAEMLAEARGELDKLQRILTKTDAERGRCQTTIVTMAHRQAQLEQADRDADLEDLADDINGAAEAVSA